MCAFTKIKSALRQHTSQIIPPDTPAVRNRTWAASLPQNEQRSEFDGPVVGSITVHPLGQPPTVVQCSADESFHDLSIDSRTAADDGNAGTPEL
jgi:hypothetical protein